MKIKKIVRMFLFALIGFLVGWIIKYLAIAAYFVVWSLTFSMIPPSIEHGVSLNWKLITFLTDALKWLFNYGWQVIAIIGAIIGFIIGYKKNSSPKAF